MADETDLIQTLVLFVALLISAYEIRNGRRALAVQNYLTANSSFADAMDVMMDHPELQELYHGDPFVARLRDAAALKAKRAAKKPVEAEDPGDGMLMRMLYCDWLISICETTYLAQKSGMIEKGEWPFWRDWLVELHKNSDDFKKAWEWVKGKEAGQKWNGRTPTLLRMLGLAKAPSREEHDQDGDPASEFYYEYEPDFLKIVDRRFDKYDWQPPNWRNGWKARESDLDRERAAKKARGAGGPNKAA